MQYRREKTHCYICNSLISPASTACRSLSLCPYSLLYTSPQMNTSVQFDHSWLHWSNASFPSAPYCTQLLPLLPGPCTPHGKGTQPAFPLFKNTPISTDLQAENLTNTDIFPGIFPMPSFSMIKRNWYKRNYYIYILTIWRMKISSQLK